MKNYIWVFAEHLHGEAHEASLEMLGEARKQASRIQAKVCAILFGQDLASLADELIAYGADFVILYEGQHFENFDLELYLQALASVAEEYPPRIALIAATPNGTCLAPRLAARLQYGYAANTVTIAIQPDGSLRISRSVCLGKAHSVVDYPESASVVITMQPGSVGLDKANRSRKGEVIHMTLDKIYETHTKALGFVKADPKLVSLDEAERVVAAGLGFRKQEDFSLIADLGEALEAAVGGSKPTVDQRWIPRQRLIGQSSGRRISPRVFVGVGISGANYFVEGMKDSRLIIAINQDKGAPLMKMADLAVVGNLYEILPSLTRQLNERQEKKV